MKNSDKSWLPYDEDDIPLDKLCLFEVYLVKPTELEYHSGVFFKIANGRMGRIGGHFDSDYSILRYKVIDYLLPTGEEENK